MIDSDSELTKCKHVDIRVLIEYKATVTAKTISLSNGELLLLSGNISGEESQTVKLLLNDLIHKNYTT